VIDEGTVGVASVIIAIIAVVYAWYYAHKQAHSAQDQVKAAQDQVKLAQDQVDHEREKARRASTAIFLKDIAEAMQGMAAKLKAKEVPTYEGNKFNTLLESYEDAVRPYLEDQVRKDIDDLKKLASRAIHIDSDIRYVVEGVTTPDPSDLQHSLNKLAKELERSAARASAQATQIETNLLQH
jgi:hypothetical protein